MDVRDSIRYASQALLEGLFGSIDDALAHAWRFADLEGVNEKFTWVMSALVSRDDLFDLLVPRFDRLATFLVISFAPLNLHELDYAVLACIPD